MSSNVRNLLSSGTTPLDSLEKKLSNRRNKLQAAIIYGLEYEAALQVMEMRFSNLETSARDKTISAKHAIAKQQNTDNDNLLSQVGDLESNLQDLKSRLSSAVDGEEQSSVKEMVRKRANDLEEELRKLGEELTRRQILLREVVSVAERYETKSDEFKDWLGKMEQELENVGIDVILDMNKLEHQISRLKVGCQSSFCCLIASNFLID